MTIVISSKRCGSTIIQNIAYFVINKKRGLIRKYHFHVIKSNEKKLVLIRDPRDVALSIRRTILLNHAIYRKAKDLNFLDNGIIKYALDQMILMYNGNKNDDNALILRYEEIFKEGLGTYDILVDKLSKFLKIEVTIDLMNEINKEFNFKKLKSIVTNMKDFKKTDNDTTGYCFHGSHIANKKISNWQNVVSFELHNELNNKLKKYLVALEYDI